MNERIAVISLGYCKYAVPAEVVSLLSQFRKIDSVYAPGKGYIYFYDEQDADSIDVSFMRVGVILDSKPEATVVPPAPVPVPPVFVDGVIKAPPEDGSDGIQAARDLVAESGDFPSMSFVAREKA